MTHIHIIILYDIEDEILQRLKKFILHTANKHQIALQVLISGSSIYIQYWDTSERTRFLTGIEYFMTMYA